ncbi:MAG TPA: ArsR family transcriptional regulator [Thermoplasmatales archaeon]|nr:ArsR family transcriptional regulator [Thermoplasmatales archaeon]
MVFQLQVTKNTPLTGEDDYEKVAVDFLRLIGYMNESADTASIPYRLFECFLIHPDKHWLVDELAVTLEATKATVYRHLNKLKGMDILEEGREGEGVTVRKTYRLRYGNLAKAWSFVEAHVKVAMENYAETVAHLQKLVSRRTLDG